MRCVLCKREFKNYCGLTTHAAKAHCLSIKESFILFKLNGKSPLCGYKGCSTEPYFLGGTRGFSKHCSMHRGKWQEGLTVEDERLKRRGEAISRAQLAGAHWANDKQKREVAGQKIAAARRAARKPKVIGPYDHLSKGPSWAKGLTKDTDPRLLNVAKSLRLEKSIILERLSKNLYVSILDETKIENVNSEIDVKCNTCGLVQSKFLSRVLAGQGCVDCHTQSQPQRILETFVKSLGFCSKQTRLVISPYELDIWIPEKNFAIEHNGLYWHSEACNKNFKSHQEKTELCAAQGITLFHVFEDEVRDKLDIVKSMIRHRLNLTLKKIDARKCVIKQLTAKESRPFFDKNHLDGFAKAKVTFGLVFENEIVSAMSFRKPIIKADKAIELCRFASLLDHNVRGGFQRLLKAAARYFKEAYEKIISYVDQRWGTDHSYARNGFRFISYTAERFWWVTPGFKDRVNRFKIRAANGNSQAAVAKQKNMYRIWGCKNSKYELFL